MHTISVDRFVIEKPFAKSRCYLFLKFLPAFLFPILTKFGYAVPPAYYAHLAAFRARYYIEGDSDAGSSSGGAGGGDGGPRTFRPLPVIKDNVKDVMFYC